LDSYNKYLSNHTICAVKSLVDINFVPSAVL